MEENWNVNYWRCSLGGCNQDLWGLAAKVLSELISSFLLSYFLVVFNKGIFFLSSVINSFWNIVLQTSLQNMETLVFA
jgi:hypothetical protein